MMKKMDLDFVPVKKWFKSSNDLFVIAGPCSAESEEQMAATYEQIAAGGKASMLRAGIWKPRTRPNTFEGIGEVGLKWLKDAGTKHGLPVTTEVASATHVEQCLKAGIDVLWIGAKTSANPFSVQEIADALQGVSIPVLIKNPVNPDLNLWIGAIERIYNTGNRKIAAIHRGFSWYNNTNYRHLPMWQIPIELKTTFPNLDIICDPSHIAGRRDLLLDIAQKAIDLNMAGLMLETHINPDKALSDAKQQITPERLWELLSELHHRKPDAADVIFNGKLQELRAIIDQIDEDLLNHLRERMKVVEKIGEYKKDNDVTILQIERWKEIVKTRRQTGAINGLSEEFITSMLHLIHDESIRIQTAIMNNSTSPS